jgi:hypothetical protein
MMDVEEANAEQQHELRRVTLTRNKSWQTCTLGRYRGDLQLRYVNYLDVLKISQGKGSAGVL